jgi:hypothetical protein
MDARSAPTILLPTNPAAPVTNTVESLRTRSPILHFKDSSRAIEEPQAGPRR